MSDEIFVSVPAAATLSTDEIIAVTLPDGTCVAMYNVDGHLYATDDRCSHGNASLADGDLDGFRIICPFHEGAFDVRDGSPAGYPCTMPIRAYPVVERNGQIGLLMPNGNAA